MFGLGKASGKAVGEVVKEGLGGVSKILDNLVTTQKERGDLDIAFNKLQADIPNGDNGYESINAFTYGYVRVWCSKNL